MTRDEDLETLLTKANPVPDSGVLEQTASSAKAQSMLAEIVASSGDTSLEDAIHLHEHVRLEVPGRIAVLHFDDGEQNILTVPVLRAFDLAVDLCESDLEISALVMSGRPGSFSAGLDRQIFLAPSATTLESVVAVGNLARRLYASRLPIVAACTGHAVGAGALLLLAADVRVGAPGTYKVGMNEAAIGLPVPRWAAELARERLSRRDYQRATAAAHLYPPDGAVTAGYLDRIAEEDVLEIAVREADMLAEIDADAYEETVRATRSTALERIERAIEEQFGSLS